MGNVDLLQARIDNKKPFTCIRGDHICTSEVLQEVLGSLLYNKDCDEFLAVNIKYLLLDISHS